MDANAPILFFDSGVGGLSVLGPTRALLPNAPIVYAADSAGFPYGASERGRDRGARAGAARAAGRALPSAPRRHRLQHRLDHRARPCPRRARPADRRHGAGDQARRRNLEKPGDRRARHRGDGPPALCRRPRQPLRRRLHDHPPRLARAGRCWPRPSWRARQVERRAGPRRGRADVRCAGRDSIDTIVLACTHFPLARRGIARRLPGDRFGRRRRRDRPPHRLRSLAASHGQTRRRRASRSSPPPPARQARRPRLPDSASTRSGSLALKLRVVRNGLRSAARVKGARERGTDLELRRIFRPAIDRLHEEGRYRVFIDILRTKGSYPNAHCFAGHNGPKPITVWCSNDYLGMGQHPAVIEAMENALHEVGAGSGGTRNIGGNTHYHIELEAELAEPPRQGGGAAVHLGLRLERGGAVDARQAASRLRDLLRRTQPRLDDRRDQEFGLREARVPPQRPRPSRGVAAAEDRRDAQADRVRKRLFDGRRHRADRGDLRPRRQLRGADLSRRGPCGRHVRRARRRHFRARRRRRPAHDHRGHARQGVRRDGRLYRGGQQHHRLHPQLCAGLHLHHLAVAGAGRRRARQRPPPEGSRPRSARRQQPAAAMLKGKFDDGRPAA